MPSAVDPGESSQPEARSGPARADETDDGTARHETEADRLDRNFDELLEELWASQTGTLILFAFLLGVAYTRPFRRADTFVHVVYAATLLLSAVATALLIAPVALHRTLFRHGRKGWLV